MSDQFPLFSRPQITKIYSEPRTRNLDAALDSSEFWVSAVLIITVRGWRYPASQ